jgi:hypothetical protein
MGWDGMESAALSAVMYAVGLWMNGLFRVVFFVCSCFVFV